MNMQGKPTHSTLYGAAKDALKEGYTIGEAFEVLQTMARFSDRRVPDRELYGALQSARLDINGQSAVNRWPPVDLAFRVEVLRRYAVERASLRKSVPTNLHTHEALASLYRPQDLLCVARTATDFETRPLDTLREPETFEFINPSPMTALFGQTQAGEYSAHAKSNTGPRVYAVIEFDSGEAYEHCCLHSFLATRLPLVMLVFSGATSVHGWFKTSHVDEDIVKDFYVTAVALGADWKMHSPCQFTRIPGGRHHGTGKKQTILLKPQHVYHQT